MAKLSVPGIEDDFRLLHNFNRISVFGLIWASFGHSGSFFNPYLVREDDF
jgi:hypothetical protein